MRKQKHKKILPLPRSHYNLFQKWDLNSCSLTPDSASSISIVSYLHKIYSINTIKSPKIQIETQYFFKKFYICPAFQCNKTLNSSFSIPQISLTFLTKKWQTCFMDSWENILRILILSLYHKYNFTYSVHIVLIFLHIKRKTDLSKVNPSIPTQNFILSFLLKECIPIYIL